MNKNITENKIKEYTILYLGVYIIFALILGACSLFSLPGEGVKVNMAQATWDTKRYRHS